MHVIFLYVRSKCILSFVMSKDNDCQGKNRTEGIEGCCRITRVIREILAGKATPGLGRVGRYEYLKFIWDIYINPKLFLYLITCLCDLLPCDLLPKIPVQLKK